MATVYPQHRTDEILGLPSGWECRYDPRTGKNYYINHLEHTTTWEDPRLKLPQFQQYEGGGTFQADERCVKKLCLQFPTVDESHIWQLLKQYHNRENVAVSALLAEGHPRAQTPPNAVETMTPVLQQRLQYMDNGYSTRFSGDKSNILAPQPDPIPIEIDEALMYKLHNFFPSVELDYIKRLLRKHSNQEHEVITALVACGNFGGRIQTINPGSPKMKLRYLKLVFPEADEAMLFDVLYNCDLNTNEAGTRLLGMGYKKRDTPTPRANRFLPLAPRSSSTDSPKRVVLSTERTHLSIPPSNADKNRLIARLQEQYPAVAKALLSIALDTSGYNEERAKNFLNAMTPQDSQKKPPMLVSPVAPVPPSGEPPVGSVSTSQPVPTTSGSQPAPEYPHENSAPARSSVTSQDIQIIKMNEENKDNSSCIGTPIKKTKEMSPDIIEIEIEKEQPEKQKKGKSRMKFCQRIIKISKATSTSESNDNQYTSSNRTQPKGPNSGLRKGAFIGNLLRKYIPWLGPDSRNRKGADSSLRQGANPQNLGAKTSRAKGPQQHLIQAN